MFFVKVLLSFLIIFSSLMSNIQVAFAKTSQQYITKQYTSGYKTDKGKDLIRLRVYSKDGGINHYDPSNPTGRRWGQWAFCIEHGKEVVNGESFAQMEPISGEFKKAARVAYLGFYSHPSWLPGVSNDALNLGYARTQMLIWQVLNQANQNYQVDSQYNSWKKGIMEQLNKWDLMPSFHNQNISMELGDKQTLVDQNQVLKYYDSFMYEKEGVTFSHQKGQNSMLVSVSTSCQKDEVIISEQEALNKGLSKYQNTQKQPASFVINDTNKQQDKMCASGYNDPKGLAIRIHILQDGTLKITKKDDHGSLVSGVSFMLSYQQDLSNPIGTYTTLNDGTVEIPHLKPKKVYIKEVKVPDYLILNNQIHSVDIKANMINTFTAVNKHKQGYLKVVKKDSHSGKVIKQAHIAFDVYNTSQQKICRIETNKEGIATSPLLDYGTYYVKEVKAPSGYICKVEVSQNVDVHTHHKTYEIVVYNEPIKGHIKVLKKDSIMGVAQGEASLKGAIYGLYAKEDILDPSLDGTVLISKGTKVSEKSTNEKGEITFDNLSLGKYEIKELKASPGYVLDSQTYTIDLTTQEHISIVEKECVVKERVQSQAFQIIKISSDENGQAQLLKGAEFTIKAYQDVIKYGGFEKAPIALNDQGKPASIMVTDEKGYALSDRLPYGHYIVRETKVPEGKYEVKDFEVVIDHDSSEPQVWRVMNDTSFKAIIQIVKKDKDTNKVVLLKDTSFKIKNKDNNEYVGYWKWGPFPHYVDTFYTDENGQVTLDKALPVGHYRLEEIKAPDGYLLNKEGVDFEISSYQAHIMLPDQKTPLITVEMKDQRVLGQISIEKKGEVLIDYKEQQFVYDEVGLQGVEFNIIASKDILDSATKEVIYNKGQIVSKITSNKNGIALSPKLPLGHYDVQEVKSLDGFVMNQKKYHVELKYKDQHTALILEKLNLQNQRQRVDLKVYKQDEDMNVYLSGAVFGLYAHQDIKNNQGKVIVKKGMKIDEVVSNDQGLICFNQDLPLAKYRVKEEKAPLGYIYEEHSHVFDCTLDHHSPIISLKHTVKNKISEMKFIKRDAKTQQPLKGAHLTVYEKDNKQVFDSWVSTGEPHVIKGLEIGKTYIFEETSSPYGYFVSKPIEFVVKNQREVVEIKMDDEIIVGRLKWYKSGLGYQSVVMGQCEYGPIMSPVSSEMLIPGAAITIYAAEDISRGLYNYNKDDEIEMIESGKQPVYSKYLPVGRYYYVETKTPYGYIEDPKKHYFTIEDERDVTSQVVESHLYNDKAKFELSLLKVLEPQEIFKDSQAYRNVLFGIYTKENISIDDIDIPADTLVYTSGINEKGLLVNPINLPRGKYYIKELQTDPKYQLDLEKYYFEIKYPGKNVNQVKVTINDGMINNELKRGNIELLKTSYGNHLKDAQFTIAKDREFKHVIATQTTNQEGYICFKNLEMGTYYIKEIKAPYGYIKRDDIYEVNLDNHQQVITLKAHNEPILTDVVVLKKDSTSKELILKQDIVFGLYSDRECNKLIQKGYAIKDGQIVFKDLPYGLYYLKELQAPDGYRLSHEIKTIIISNQTPNDYFIDYMNKKNVLVKTNDNHQNYIVALIVSLIVALLIKRQRVQ